MMTKLTCDVIKALQGSTLSVAESCTGGLIGSLLTAVPGSSRVFKGGIISYTNEVKNCLLQIPEELLSREGAVSAPVAEAMAANVRRLTNSDFSLSVTGLAGPGGDEFNNPVGTVFIGFADANGTCYKKFLFDGDRDEVRRQAAEAALSLLLSNVNKGVGL